MRLLSVGLGCVLSISRLRLRLHRRPCWRPSVTTMPEETVVNHRASRSRSRARLKRNQTLCRLYQALSLHLLLLLEEEIDWTRCARLSSNIRSARCCICYSLPWRILSCCWRCTSTGTLSSAFSSERSWERFCFRGSRWLSGGSTLFPLPLSPEFFTRRYQYRHEYANNLSRNDPMAVTKCCG